MIVDGKNILIVALLDCRADLGMEEAIACCKLFEETGAHLVYAENLDRTARVMYNYDCN